jgi:hypothetical protein
MDEDCELESASAVLRGHAPGATLSQISNRATRSEATTADQAVRPISAVLCVCWFMSTTCHGASGPPS